MPLIVLGAVALAGIMVGRESASVVPVEGSTVLRFGVAGLAAYGAWSLYRRARG